MLQLRIISCSTTIICGWVYCSVHLRSSEQHHVSTQRVPDEEPAQLSCVRPEEGEARGQRLARRRRRLRVRPKEEEATLLRVRGAQWHSLQRWADEVCCVTSEALPWLKDG